MQPISGKRIELPSYRDGFSARATRRDGGIELCLLPEERLQCKNVRVLPHLNKLFSRYVHCAAINNRCSLNVIRGSGKSRRNFLSKAASWTGLSCERSTDDGSRSMASVRSLSRLILPFFRKIPSIDISTGFKRFRDNNDRIK